MMVTPAEAAHQYATAGWPLVPLHPGGKRPLIKTGRDHAEAATCDLGQVAEWWSTWPDAGIGLVCAAGGFVVIDVDGPEGIETFRAHDGPYPLTCGAISGRESGGFHVYYRVPPGVRPPRSRLLGPGVELKGAGSLVVLPPSLHRSGRRYAWDVAPRFMAEGFPAWGADYGLGPEPPPGWMLDSTKTEAQTIPMPRVSSLNGHEATRYGARALLEELERLAQAQEGTRNDTLYRVAVRLAELAAAGHLDPARARQRVELVAEHTYQGADAAEREATIDSAFGKVAVA